MAEAVEVHRRLVELDREARGLQELDGVGRGLHRPFVGDDDVVERVLGLRLVEIEDDVGLARQRRQAVADLGGQRALIEPGMVAVEVARLVSGHPLTARHVHVDVRVRPLVGRVAEAHPDAEPALAAIRALDIEAVVERAHRLGVGEAAAIGLRHDHELALRDAGVLDQQNRGEHAGDLLRMGAAEHHQRRTRLVGLKLVVGRVAVAALDAGRALAQHVLRGDAQPGDDRLGFAHRPEDPAGHRRHDDRPGQEGHRGSPRALLLAHDQAPLFSPRR
jgi:hypothetical protein